MQATMLANFHATSALNRSSDGHVEQKSRIELLLVIVRRKKNQTSTCKNHRYGVADADINLSQGIGDTRNNDVLIQS